MGEVLKLGNIIFQTPILIVGSLFLKIEWRLQNVAPYEGGGFGIINGDETNEIIIQVGNSSCHDWTCYPWLCGDTCQKIISSLLEERGLGWDGLFHDRAHIGLLVCLQYTKDL